MIVCNHLTDIYPRDNKGKCEYKHSVINLEDCNNCRHRFFKFNDMKIGQFFLDIQMQRYCIKVTNDFCFDLDNNVMVLVTHNDSFALLCDYEVW